MNCPRCGWRMRWEGSSRFSYLEWCENVYHHCDHCGYNSHVRRPHTPTRMAAPICRCGRPMSWRSTGLFTGSSVVTWKCHACHALRETR